MAVEEALQLNVKRREAKSKGEKEMATHFSILTWKIPWTEELDKL